MSDAEKLDLDGIRRRVQHRTILSKDLCTLLAAVHRVLAIPDNIGCEHGCYCSRETLHAVREALEVKDA